MNKTLLALALLERALRLANRGIRTEILNMRHVPVAAQLLSAEFARREPLCKVLQIPADEMLEFFRQQVAHVAKSGLGVVALDQNNVVCGVITVEDHTDPFVPNVKQIGRGLNLIGAYLDSVPLPERMQTSQYGDLFYSALAAIDSRIKNPTLLITLAIAAMHNLKQRGYTQGYAIVTNSKVLRRFAMAEKVVGKGLFKVESSMQPARFRHKNRYPFKSYEGETVLLSLQVP